MTVSGKAGSSCSGGTGVIGWRVGRALKRNEAACGTCEGRAFFQLSGVSCATCEGVLVMDNFPRTFAGGARRGYSALRVLVRTGEGLGTLQCSLSRPLAVARFPRPGPANLVQGVELHRGRFEARCLIRFAATAGQVCFPDVAQAARQSRASGRPGPKSDGIETDWLITSCPAGRCSSPPDRPVGYQLEKSAPGIGRKGRLPLDSKGGPCGILS
jgi:hypothetical protein